jgi:hypothetical protein
VGNILADFFTNASGHPARQQKLSGKRNSISAIQRLYFLSESETKNPIKILSYTLLLARMSVASSVTGLGEISPVGNA